MLYNFYNLEISNSEGIYLPKNSCSPSFRLFYQALKHSFSIIINILESYLLQIRYTRSFWLSRIKRSFIVLHCIAYCNCRITDRSLIGREVIKVYEDIDHGENVMMAQYIFNCLSEAIFQETSSEIDYKNWRCFFHLSFTVNNLPWSKFWLHNLSWFRILTSFRGISFYNNWAISINREWFVRESRPRNDVGMARF